MVRKAIISISFFFLSGCTYLLSYDMDSCPQNYFLENLCLCPERRFNPYQSEYDYNRYDPIAEECSRCSGVDYGDFGNYKNGYPAFYGLHTSAEPTYHPYTGTCCPNEKRDSCDDNSCNNRSTSCCGRY